MTWKTHIAGGLGAGLAAVSLGLANMVPDQPYLPLPIYWVPIGLACAVVGGLFPDIDWHTSKVGASLKPISRLINLLFGHRTLFHAPLLYVLSFYLLKSRFYTLYWALLPFTAGTMSHLLLDTMNYKGVPLFYPFSRKHYHIAEFSADDFAERVFRTAVIIMDIALVFFLIINLLWLIGV